MARGAVIEQDELFETANQLEADGKEVTAMALLNALGRGSLTTIYKYLEAWKTNRPVKVSTGNSEIPETVRNAFASTWRVAAQEAAREVEAVKEKAAEEVKEALGQFRGALEAIERLEKESEADALEIDGLKKQSAEQQAEVTRLEADKAAQGATIDELRRRDESQAQELERLHKDLERQRSERDTAMKEAAELKGRSETLKSQNEKLMASLGSKDKH